MSTAERIRVLIADDHSVVRHGLRALLEADPALEVVGESGDVEETVREARRTGPDVMLLDLGMPGGGGIAVLERLASAGHAVPTLVLTMHDDPVYIRSAFAAGAQGYMVKSSRGADLVAALRAVARGERYVDGATTRSVVGEIVAGGQPPAPRAVAVLSNRERQVLQLLAEGHTNAEVGERLGISVKTVETHRARLTRKLGARSRADLVRVALTAGLLAPDPNDHTSGFPPPESG